VSTRGQLPTLGLTIGDVAGIGPEITAKALLLHPDIRDTCRPVAIGDADVMRKAVRLIGRDPGCVVSLDRVADLRNDPSIIEIVQEGPSLGHLEAGVLSPLAGHAAVRYVKRACLLAREGVIDGIVTAPLNKEAMHAGGHKWPGHTELLAHEFGVERFGLVLSAGNLYVFHITTHVGLRQAIDALTRDRILDTLRLTRAFARALGQGDAQIGVAGLNPHAGEHGLFGNEEITTLQPAVEQARREGINAVGPLPADALFPAAVRGKFSFVVVCYHDQGHVAFKSVYGDEGVNITVGLPVVRVSVDHGTAFDIAGKGIAREASLLLAAERAAALAPWWKGLTF